VNRVLFLMKRFFPAAVLALLLLAPVCASAIGFAAEDVYASVVVIQSGNSYGSGFAIGGSRIITNAHVINDRRNVVVSVYQDQNYEATVLSLDKTLDLAVLDIGEKKLPYLAMEDYSDLAVGADVYAIGAPLDMAYTLTKGVLSAKDRILDGRSFLQTDAPVNSGNSGGPLLDENGRVIGINTLKLTDSEGIGLAIPMTAVAKFLQDNGIGIEEQSDAVSALAKKNPTVSSDTGEPNPESPRDGTENTPFEEENLRLKIWIAALAAAELITLLSLLLVATGRRKRAQTERQRNFTIDLYD
jgi:serine protease Do